MRLEELKKGLWGYKKEGVFQYITELEETCSRKLQDREAQAERAEQQAGERIRALEQENGALKEELAAVAGALVSGDDLRVSPLTEKHAGWAEGFRDKYAITPDNALEIVERETGLVFAQVLEQAGVYKRTEEGKAAFLRFLDQV